MKNSFHKETANKWFNYSIFEQMANIGAEVGRAIKWRKRDKKMFLNAFYRVIELIDLTVQDPKNKNRLKEILRVKELLGDYFLGKNQYRQNDQQWEKYFYFYALAVRKNF